MTLSQLAAGDDAMAPSRLSERASGESSDAVPTRDMMKPATTTTMKNLTSPTIAFTKNDQMSAVPKKAKYGTDPMRPRLSAVWARVANKANAQGMMKMPGRGAGDTGRNEHDNPWHGEQ